MASTGSILHRSINVYCGDYVFLGKNSPCSSRKAGRQRLWGRFTLSCRRTTTVSFGQTICFYMLMLFTAYCQLIECQVSSCCVSNGPMLASTCTLNFPLKLLGARHEYLQVPPQPYLNLPEVRTLPASSTMLKPGAGCRCLFF